MSNGAERERLDYDPDKRKTLKILSGLVAGGIAIGLLKTGVIPYADTTIVNFGSSGKSGPLEGKDKINPRRIIATNEVFNQVEFADQIIDGDSPIRFGGIREGESWELGLLGVSLDENLRDLSIKGDVKEILSRGNFFQEPTILDGPWGEYMEFDQILQNSILYITQKGLANVGTENPLVHTDYLILTAVQKKYGEFQLAYAYHTLASSSGDEPANPALLPGGTIDNMNIINDSSVQLITDELTDAWKNQGNNSGIT